MMHTNKINKKDHDMGSHKEGVQIVNRINIKKIGKSYQETTEVLK